MPQLGPEPFVGRVAELSWLTHAFDRARSGEGSLTVILGEAGSGKTRLVDELASNLSPVSFAWAAPRTRWPPARSSQTNSAVIALDDLQWADDASLHLLHPRFEELMIGDVLHEDAQELDVGRD